MRDITEGPAGTQAEHFTDMSGTLFFFRKISGSHQTELWKSDGTEAGTVLVKGFETFRVDDAVVAGGELFFSATPPEGGSIQLWRSDGTTAGTRVIREHDLQIGSARYFSHSIAEVEGMLLFAGESGSSGLELWRTDGTDGGTILVQEIAPGDASSNPNGFVTAGRRVYFAADDGVRGAELWGGYAAIVTHQPRRAVEELSEDLRDASLSSGGSTSLRAKLDAALRALDRGAVSAAVHSLRVFSSEVTVLRGKRIPPAEADELLDFSRGIVALLEGDAP